MIFQRWIMPVPELTPSIVHPLDHILILDAQMFLLSMAEHMRLRRFYATSWNLDWEKSRLDYNEAYDSYTTLS